MKLAIMADDKSLGTYVKERLENEQHEIRAFIGDGEGEISFCEFKHLYYQRVIDGILLLFHPDRIKYCVRKMQLNNIRNIGVFHALFFNYQNYFQLVPSVTESINWLGREKSYISHLEMNIIDSCNLNCKGCTHFSNLFREHEFYSLENFECDIRWISKKFDVLNFWLLGGEPLLKKDLPSYIEIVRENFPKAGISIVTNGLLVPTVEENLFDCMRENGVNFQISMYPPTYKIRDEIAKILNQKDVLWTFKQPYVKEFNIILKGDGTSNEDKSRSNCRNDGCRILRNGKIYKCPLDALMYRYKERYPQVYLPESTGVSIYNENAPILLDELDGAIELCKYCAEIPKVIPWTQSLKPDYTDWLI